MLVPLLRRLHSRRVGVDDDVSGIEMFVELRPQRLWHGIDFAVFALIDEALNEGRRTRLDFRAADRFQKCHDKVETVPTLFPVEARRVERVFPRPMNERDRHHRLL